MSDQKEKLVRLITALAATFGREPSEALITGYWLGLRSLPLADAMRGVQRALEECDRMPTVAEIRSMAGVLTDSQRADRAFEALRRAISGHGAHASVNFDDPLINATVRCMGGWSALCSRPADAFDVWTKKEFVQVYEGFCSSGITAEAGRYLPGTHEGNNAAAYPEFVRAPAEVETGLPVHKVVARLAAHSQPALSGRLRELAQGIGGEE